MRDGGVGIENYRNEKGLPFGGQAFFIQISDF
jgi:hypothetical protein